MDDFNNNGRRETPADRIRRRQESIQQGRGKMGKISPFTVIALLVIIAMVFLLRGVI